MAESIDIFDANLTFKGSMERVAAHQAGEWHRTFHCWVVNGAGEPRLLFQMRSAAMESFPSILDISAAGHLAAGESIDEGVREVREELGIDFANEDLHPLGERVEVADQANGQKNREYQSVYLLRLDTELDDYQPQVEEVAGLFWVPVAACLELFTGERPTVESSGITYDDGNGTWVNAERVLGVADFLPRIQRYYLTAAIMADRLVKGERPLSIS